MSNQQAPHQVVKAGACARDPSYGNLSGAAPSGKLGFWWTAAPGRLTDGFAVADDGVTRTVGGAWAP
jgi:hypothetical protein